MKTMCSIPGMVLPLELPSTVFITTKTWRTQNTQLWCYASSRLVCPS